MVYGNEFHLFWSRHIPYSKYFCCKYDRAAVDSIFNLGLGRDSNPSPNQKGADALRVTPQSHGKI